MERNMGNVTEQPVKSRKTRNQAIECVRLLAAVSVVIVHCQPPGVLGTLIDCLARFSVPFFFAVTGYFSYGANESTIRKRTGHILKLNVSATLFYLLWGMFREKYIYGLGRMPWLLETFSAERLTRWVLGSTNPLSLHLWYLSAVLGCYIVLDMYVRWYRGKCNYNHLYMICFFLYIGHLTIGSILNICEIYVPSSAYRNMLFYGLPMFGLGIFIGEHQQRILETYRLSRGKLAAIILAGAVFSLIEWEATGYVEMPAGTILEVIALMLLLGSSSRAVCRNSLGSMVISKFGELSTLVYIVHMFCKELYGIWNIDQMLPWGESVVDYLRPFLVLLLSFVISILWMILKSVTNRIICGCKGKLRAGNKPTDSSV